MIVTADAARTTPEANGSAKTDKGRIGEFRSTDAEVLAPAHGVDVVVVVVLAVELAEVVEEVDVDVVEDVVVGELVVLPPSRVAVSVPEMPRLASAKVPDHESPSAEIVPLNVWLSWLAVSMLPDSVPVTAVPYSSVPLTVLEPCA
jgi:hypothetical protein